VKSHLLFAAASLLCATAFAQNQPAPSTSAQAAPSTSSIFDALDTDKDGRVSQAEAGAHPVVSKSFGQADANGDGGISREEFSAAFTMRSPDAAAPPPASPPQQEPKQ
jgi:hypothetical protein